MQVIVLIDSNLNWAKGESLANCLRNFKRIHKYDFNFFNKDGDENSVIQVTSVKDIDDVFVDDIGQLHYKDGSITNRL
jgi:hypothetical protein